MGDQKQLLHDAILADPKRAEPYWVYGDHLQSLGDPHGQLIALSSAWERQPERRRQWSVAMRRLLTTHSKHILGPLADDGDPALFARWRYGFIAEARISEPSERFWEVDPLPVVERLLRSPAAVFLQRLVVFCHPRFHGDIHSLARRQGPSTLRQVQLARRHTDLEEALDDPEDALWLWLDLPEEQQGLPARLFTLKNLERLELAAPLLTELPLQLGWLSALAELDVSTCRALKAIPDVLFRLPRLERIKACAPGWDSQRLRQMNRLLKDLSAIEAAGTQRELECALLRGADHQIALDVGDEQLVAALDCSVSEVRDGAFSVLDARLGGAKAARVPLEPGAKVLLRGVSPGVRAWATAVLPGMGVDVQRRPTKSTTHVVLGRGGTVAQALAATSAAELMMQGELERLLRRNGLAGPVTPEDVLGAALGAGAVDVDHALSALEAGSPGLGLCLDLLVVSGDPALTRGLRQRALTQLEQRDPHMLRSSRKHLGSGVSRCGEGKLSAKIRAFVDDCGADGSLFARLLCGRLGRGVNYLLEHGNGEDRRWVFDRFREDDHLDLSFRELNGLCVEDGELEGLRGLDVSMSLFEALPLGVCSIDTLERICLDGCTRLKGLPVDFVDLKALSVVSWADNHLSQFPVELTSLCRLEVLNLDGDSGASPMRRLSDHMGALRRLRQLGLAYAQLDSLPDGLFRLESLEELRLTGAQLPEAPPELVRLGCLRKLVISGSSWDRPESRRRIQRMLPGCTLQ